MRGIAKAALISILVSIAMVLFFNMIFFFPWYMTLIEETFNLSQAAAHDNYLKQSYYDDALDRLKGRPIFNKREHDIIITVTNERGDDAVGNDDESVLASYSDDLKPYMQAGSEITITIQAKYPLSIKLWGEDIEMPIDASFSLTTIGLKHYKDLPE